MPQADELMKGFSLGQQTSRWKPLGDAIRSTLERLRGQEDLVTQTVTKAGIEQMFQNPLDVKYKQAQIEYMNRGRIGEKITDTVKKEAYTKYKQGDRSPQVLKTLGMWVSPMDEMMARQFGYYNPETVSNNQTVPEGISSEDWNNLSQNAKDWYLKNRGK